MKKVFYSLLAVLFLTTVAEAGKVSIAPLSATVDIGTTFTVDIVGLDFISGIDGGGINLQYNPNVLDLNSVTVDTTKWGSWSGPGTIDHSAGTLSELWFMAPLDVVKGNFPIATAQFTAIHGGKSDLLLSEWTGNPFGSGGELMQVSMENGMLDVHDPNALGNGNSTAPEPATISLLLAGLGLVGYKKTKK